MDRGHWVPMCKNLVCHLPKDRPFSKVEAAYSLQVDYDNEKPVTLTGYANLWQWSKGKVLRFFKEMGVSIVYLEDTSKRQNQNGLITDLITDRSEEKNGLIRFLNSKGSRGLTDRSENQNGLKTDRSRVTTIKTRSYNPKNLLYDADMIYAFFVSEIDPVRKSKTRAVKNIKKYLKRGITPETLKAAILNYKSILNGTDPQYRKDPANFFGINEPYAVDYYPENFEPSRPKTETTTAIQPPAEFDFERQFHEE